MSSISSPFSYEGARRRGAGRHRNRKVGGAGLERGAGAIKVCREPMGHDHRNMVGVGVGVGGSLYINNSEN